VAVFDRCESTEVRDVDTITSRLAFSKTTVSYCAVRYTGVTPPLRDDGVNQDHVEGFSVKRELISTCIQAIIIVF
jgi:hypothetical protein